MTDNSKTPGKLLFEKLAINLDEVPFEQVPDYTAVEYFLTCEDEPSSDADNLDKIKRYLEASEHLYKIEDWNRAKEIIIFPLPLNGITETKIYLQLGSWGFYKEQIELCNKMLNKVDKETDSFFLNALSIVYMYLGDYQKVIDYNEQFLVIAEQITNLFFDSTVV
ncbi:tetratricopeptide repeat protein, partial [Moorena sp. SIO4A5]|uniref:tetratricopeptide repeat protein n=1 Tax=Moorena sp. SIO4A5 TaxID=2607838 RepID=UPI0013CACA25